MTEKIYYGDVMCRTFEAVVQGCVEEKGRMAVILDRTAFYPEGGGQPGDQGMLRTEDGREIRVEDTREKEEEIRHYVSDALEPGTKVTGCIDWQRRFDHMQNHSGEHIVSGLIHERFGYNNVGFHMGADCMTIDLDGPITWQELKQIEQKANEAVWRDEPVEICVYDQEGIRNQEYRSKKELTGDVRLVTFPGSDTCACCGTHVQRTGQIGLIKLLSVVKFKGGVRIEMLCGRMAASYMDAVFEENRTISVQLSARPLHTSEAVAKLKAAAQADAFRAEQLEREAFKRLAQEFAGEGSLLLFQPGLNPDGVRRLTDEILQGVNGLCAVFSGDDEKGYKYAVGEKEADLRAFVKEMNEALRGHGGGRPYFAQGNAAATREEIAGFFKASRPEIRLVGEV